MLSFRESVSLIVPYVRKRIGEQIKAVFFIVSYMVLFQTLILGMPIAESTTIATGLAFVILGLALFMEGLVLGLMPLGEMIGLKMPAKASRLVILVFAFGLGLAATYAEPAIGVLRRAGQDVKVWQAPLLFRLLNQDSHLLVYAVATGVGLAVVCGVLRFIFQWSLKPFLFVTVPLVLALSLYASSHPELAHVLGLAWDSGAVTTGPVTVPLVLALGIGINRMTATGGEETGGFGVVTLASLFPIISVLCLSIGLSGSTPAPMSADQFAQSRFQDPIGKLFPSEDAFNTYRATNLATQQDSLSGPESSDLPDSSASDTASSSTNLALIASSIQAAMRAIIPLSAGLIFVLFIFLREKLMHNDELILGIVFAVLGMSVFNLGIELGLSNLGKQIGRYLPSSYQEITLDEINSIENFSPQHVYQAISKDGVSEPFFYTHSHRQDYRKVPFLSKNYNSSTQTYRYQKSIGPLFGGHESNSFGALVVLLFAFFMGYGATLAEPALNTLGATVETITIGAIKKALLMQSVAIGVGIGLGFGIAKIIWDIPLIYLVLPPYLLLLVLTKMSSEDFANIAWDSAGVTTGPITVPLVIAMGLGIGTQSGVIEGFGLLAMASVCPIVIVLSVGLIVSQKQQTMREKTVFKSADQQKQQESANLQESA